ncbi:unnamed protein product [Trichobilharzia regenti]|nr:unnamed protein product [Trichobilharzia regenti]
MTIYRNFQRLSLAVYLFSHPRFYKNYLEGCRVELINFLNQFEVIYGRKHLVYNIYCLQHLAEDANQMGPLESFSAFPFESYMQTIRRSIHSNNAIAKQAANRFAEKKGKKNYAVLWKAGSKELFIAARSWMLSEDLCLYHSSITDNEVEACVGPRPEWVLTDCQMLAELAVIVSKFVSATMSDDDVKKILKKTVKAYFHDIRDRIDKRETRRRVAVDNKKSDQRISPVSYHLNKYMP